MTLFLIKLKDEVYQRSYEAGVGVGGGVWRAAGGGRV